MIFFTFLELSRSLYESNTHFQLIETIIQTLHIAFTSIYSITKQFNVSHLYLNGLVNFFASFELLTFAYELNHSF
jgi:hypothetical protein